VRIPLLHPARGVIRALIYARLTSVADAASGVTMRSLAGFGEAGMTLVEVLVAMVILLVGVLGVIPLLDNANTVTGDNKARDTATALVREELEKIQELSALSLVDPIAVATTLTPKIHGSSTARTKLPTVCSEHPTACQGRQPVDGALSVPPTFPDGGSPPDGITVVPVSSSFTTSRDGIDFETAVSSCVLDHPSDGIGVATGAPCEPLSAGSGGGGAISTSGPTSLNLNVVGIQITGGGALTEVACSLLGTRGSVLDGLLGSGSLLGGLVSSGADTTFCSGKGNVAYDRQPIDAVAVTSTVSWRQTRSGRGGSVTQRVVISGPRVTS
jgi:prepilin-type N-terminal cleavage/methylation domain-containing protein